MDDVQELRAEFTAPPRASVEVQGGTYFLELSLDWIICRASQNIHHMLGCSHVTLIDEPLGDFVHGQPLHDLRNLFSRLSGSTGIARAYGVRLTDHPETFDFAFQHFEERVILEAVPSPKARLGETLSAVGGLGAGLSRESGEGLIEAAARRMRALTAFDRVTLLIGGDKATSSRTGIPFRPGANASLSDDMPVLVPDALSHPIPLFPGEDEESLVAGALLQAPTAAQKAELLDRGFGSTMRVPVVQGGETIGEFRLAHMRPRPASFEIHAAAELFAQLFALRLEVDRLKKG